jgi:hypothetical protein
MTVLRVDTIAASGQTSENTGSVFFDGTGDYIKSSIDSEDFAFPGDFAMECWVQKVGNGAHADSIGNVIMMTGNASNNRNGLWISVTNAGSLVAKVAYDTSSWALEISGGTLSNDVWYHVALTRSGSTVRLFLNGVQQASGSNSTDVTTTYSNAFSVGGQFNPVGTRHVNGYVSNARICKGTALYTSNFTVPTRELEVTPETVILCCYDGENIFAEKTGKIIAAYGDRLSSPTPTATDSPIGITTNYPPVTRGVDVTAGPTLDGDLEFNSQNFFVLPKGTTTEQFPDFGAVDASSARGLFGGGRNPSGSASQNTIDFVTISSLGNAADFGDLTAARTHISSSSSSTRGIWAGGYNPAGGDKNIIHYVTISSTGNALDFGDLTQQKFGVGSCSNSTRSVFGAGYVSSPVTQVNTIEYITIQSIGNVQDFGDLTQVRAGVGACSSSTRGVFSGGYTPDVTNIIDYITISTTANAVDFGDLTQARAYVGGCSNSTRGIFSGGWNPSNTNTIDFITISTLGNAADFGDLTRTANQPAACSSATRGIFGGGTDTDNTIDYVTIATTGDAQDFGDLTQARRNAAACSNGHGGLG